MGFYLPDPPFTFLGREFEKASASKRRGMFPYLLRYMRWAIENFLYVQPIDGPPQLIKLNNIQRRALARILYDMYVRKKPGRYVWLKARRMGVSTICAAIVYILTRFDDSRVARVFASDGDTLEKSLFPIYSMFENRFDFDRFPWAYIPLESTAANLVHWMGYSEANDKVFRPGVVIGPDRLSKEEISKEKALHGFMKSGGSQILIKTAGTTRAGAVGGRSHCNHYSEVGDDGPDWEAVSTASNQQTPPVPGTLIFYEGTTHLPKVSSAGSSTWLRSKWEGAADYPHNGPEAQRFFDGWWEFELYRAPLENGEDVAPFGLTDAERARDEKDMKSLRAMMRDRWGYDVANAKRRKKIEHDIEEALKWRNTIGLPILCDSNIDAFHSQYPSTPQEAFVTRSRGFFQGVLLNERLDSIDRWEAKLRATVPAPEYPKDVSLRSGAEETPRLRVFYPPTSDGYFSDSPTSERWAYLIAHDPSYGKGGDPSAAIVYNPKLFRVEATWMSNLNAYEQAEELAALGNMYSIPVHDRVTGDIVSYSSALIAPEANAIGTEVIRNLISGDIAYDAKKVWNRPASGGGYSGVDRKGFYTTPRERESALASLQEQWVTWEIRDRRVIEQMGNFGYNRQNKPEALAGHDEFITCMWIIAYICATLRKYGWVRSQEADYEHGPKNIKLLTLPEQASALEQQEHELIRRMQLDPKLKLNDQLDALRVRRLGLMAAISREVAKVDGFKRKSISEFSVSRSPRSRDWRGMYMTG